jgi:hypothetical protein
VPAHGGHRQMLRRKPDVGVTWIDFVPDHCVFLLEFEAAFPAAAKYYYLLAQATIPGEVRR